MKIQEYQYEAAPIPGLIFISKSFVAETNDYIYVISPANSNKSLISDLKEKTKPLIFLAPNNFHNIGIAQMKEDFPTADFYGPKRSSKQSGVELDRMNDLPKDNEFEAIYLRGNKSLSETVFLHKPTKSLIVTDILFNMHHKMNFLSRMVFKFYGTYNKLAQSKLIKIMTKEKVLFRESLHSLTKLDFNQVLLNHGDHISKAEFDTYILRL